MSEQEQLCPKCNEPCDRDEADVGVGIIYGPWGCRCGWSSDPYYDSSEGKSQAQRELGDAHDRYVDSRGVSVSVRRVEENLKRFGIKSETVREVFGTLPVVEDTPRADT